MNCPKATTLQCHRCVILLTTELYFIKGYNVFECGRRKGLYVLPLTLEKKNTGKSLNYTKKIPQNIFLIKKDEFSVFPSLQIKVSTSKIVLDSPFLNSTQLTVFQEEERANTLMSSNAKYFENMYGLQRLDKNLKYIVFLTSKYLLGFLAVKNL